MRLRGGKGTVWMREMKGGEKMRREMSRGEGKRRRCCGGRVGKPEGKLVMRGK